MLLTRRHITSLATSVLALSARTAQAASTEITIALSSNSFSTVALRIADEAGLFAKHDLKPHFIIAESGNASTTVMLSGSAQVAVSGPGEALAARARGQPIILIGNIYRGLSAVVVITKSAAEKSGVKPDAPVADRLRALDGLVIAAPSPTAVYGISPKLAAESVGARVKFVFIGQAAMPAAMEAGAVQGYIAGAPFWGIPVLKGTGYAWIIGNELPPAFLPTTSGSLQATEQWTKSSPDIVARLHAVVRDTDAFIAAEPDATKKVLAKLYPTTDPATLDLAFAKEWRNWVQPDFTLADVEQDIALLKKAGQGFPGLDGIKPGDMLGPQP